MKYELNKEKTDNKIIIKPIKDGFIVSYKENGSYIEEYASDLNHLTELLRELYVEAEDED